MSRFAAALLFAVAAPAAAQQAAVGGMPAEIQQASQAFGLCVRAGMDGLAATVTPEAGAASVLRGCASQRQAVERAAENMIATLPEGDRAGAREHLRSQLAQAEAQVAGAIRQRRAAPATPR